MGAGPRLRQVALVARELQPVADRLRRELALDEPFVDPGVGEFGLVNAVFEVGDTFVEVVAPVRDATTAGRYLQRRGGDSGYMAIFEMADLEEARRRTRDLDIRVVWTVDLDDMAGTHLHPKDVPGAIVSLDRATPPGSWRWAGPRWAGHIPDHRPGGITGLTVAAEHPDDVGRRWSQVLGVECAADGPATLIVIDEGRQQLRFVAGAPGGSEGITEVELAVPEQVRAGRHAVDIGGVTFVMVPPAGEE